MNDDDIRRTAIHEAGHAVVAEALGIRCDRLSVVSDGKMRGRGDYTWPLGRRGGASPDFVNARPALILYNMAGWEAEEECLGAGADTDQDDRVVIAGMLMTLIGLLASEEIDGAEERAKVAAYEQRYRARTRLLVRRHRKTIEVLADALVAQKTMTGAQVRVIIDSAPILIHTPDQVQRIKWVPRQQRDSLLGGVEMVRLALSEGHLRFPISATFPDPPDVLLCSDQRKLGVEVTRVAWQRQNQIVAEAAKNYPESLVEISPEICVDSKARPHKGARKGERSGHCEAIRLRGEPHRSPGWAGGSELDAVLDAFAVAIRKKQARLSTYSEVADKVWLFLIDDTGFAGAFSDLLSRAGARREIAEICANTGFDAIFLYQFARGRPLRVHPRTLRS